MKYGHDFHIASEYFSIINTTNSRSLIVGDKINLFFHNQTSLDLGVFTVEENCHLDNFVFIKVRDSEGRTRYVDKKGNISEQTTSSGFLEAYNREIIKLEDIDPYFFLDDKFVETLLANEGEKIKNSNSECSYKVEVATTFKDKVAKLRDEARKQKVTLVKQREDDLAKQIASDQEFIEKHKPKRVDNEKKMARKEKLKEVVDVGKIVVDGCVDTVKSAAVDAVNYVKRKIEKAKEKKKTNKEIDDIMELDD
jgi:Mg2+ and Co2+ transporter CorA